MDSSKLWTHLMAECGQIQTLNAGGQVCTVQDSEYWWPSVDSFKLKVCVDECGQLQTLNMCGRVWTVSNLQYVWMSVDSFKL